MGFGCSLDTGVPDPGERLWAALSSPGGRGYRHADGDGPQSMDGPQLRARPGGGAHIQLALVPDRLARYARSGNPVQGGLLTLT